MYYYRALHPHSAQSLVTTRLLLLSILLASCVARAAQPVQVIVKYRSSIEAAKILNGFQASPTSQSFGGTRAARVARTFAQSKSGFPIGNFLTLTFVDDAVARGAVASMNTDPLVEYVQL